MKFLVMTTIALSAIACARSAPPARNVRPAAHVETVESTDPRPTVLEPPPVLTDEGPAPKPVGNVQTADAPPPPSPQDEALRASLPFAPAIGLDPVDGSKISIRAGTPSVEYKGHLYYFESEANKRTFGANPEQFTKGIFAH